MPPGAHDEGGQNQGHLGGQHPQDLLFILSPLFHLDFLKKNL